MFLLKRVEESRFFFNVSTQHRGESERESWLSPLFSLFIVSYAVLLNFSVSLPIGV